MRRASKYCIRFIYRPKKREADEGILYVRLTINGVKNTSDKTTDIQINKSEWNAKRQKISNPVLQRRLEAIRDKLTDMYVMQFRTEEESKISPTQILKAYRYGENGQIPLTAYIQEYLNKKEKIVRENSYRAIQANMKSLLQFFEDIKEPKITLERIRMPHGEKYIKYLKDRGVTRPDIHLAYFKNILNEAVRDELLKVNPLALLRVERKQRKPLKYLTLSQIEQLKNLDLQKKSLIEYRDMFLFQCFTGLSYIDLVNFDESKVKEINGKTFIIGNRHKSNEDYTIPLLPEAKEIFQKYEGLFPKIRKENYRIGLRKISKTIGMEFTSHVGRKTFAMMMLEKGISGEVVATMLGHSNPVTTFAHYAKISPARVSLEMEKHGLIS
jgi:integrase